MSWFSFFIDVFLHLDDHLQRVIEDYGVWTYALLFTVVLLETGLVVTPILPGDSLLFAAGAFAASRSLNLTYVLVLLFVAAVVGDALNYMIGYFLGAKFLQKERPFIKKEYLEKTHRFYERYGGKTIIIARFVPIVRTFAPFLAGIGRMNYFQFARYNIVGAALWVGICVMAGYWFGRIPLVKKHFSLVILAIIAISLLPAVVEIYLARRRAARRLD